MKIRDLNLDDYVIVYDIGKSEHSEGMIVVGRVDEIIFNEDDKNEAGIDSLGNFYHFDDNNYFDLWSKSIEDKTESVSETKWGTDERFRELRKKIKEQNEYLKSIVKYNQSNDVQQRKRNKNKINIYQLKPGDHVKVKKSEGFKKGKVIATPKTKSELYIVSIRDDYDEKIFFIDNTFEVELIQRNDTVNYPSHYNYGDIEIIDFIEQVTQHYNANVAYHIGNAIKYLARSPHKNGKEDVAKAKWYIERAFENWDK